LIDYRFSPLDIFFLMSERSMAGFIPVHRIILANKSFTHQGGIRCPTPLTFTEIFNAED
jgi:hypothetical protein